MTDVQFTYRAPADGAVNITVTSSPETKGETRLYRNRVRLVTFAEEGADWIRWVGSLRKSDLIEVGSPGKVEVTVFPTEQQTTMADIPTPSQPAPPPAGTTIRETQTFTGKKVAEKDAPAPPAGPAEKTTELRG